MNITQLEKEIVKAVNMEIDKSDKINSGIYGNEIYNTPEELKDLRRFVRKCFKEHNGK